MESRIQSAIKHTWGYEDKEKGWIPPADLPNREGQYVPLITRALGKPQERFGDLESLPKKHLIALIEFLGARALTNTQHAANAPAQEAWLEHRGHAQEARNLQRFFMVLLEMRELEGTSDE